MAIKISRFSGVYQLETATVIDAPISAVWAFFSRPENLRDITPKEMDFKMTSPPAGETFAGQIIAYKIMVLPQIRSSWITEITHVSPEKMFVDEQRAGPYAIWHHEHHFRKTGGKTEMLDRVTYKLPFGALGRLLMGRIIAGKVTEIFRFRNKAITEKFLQQNF